MLLVTVFVPKVLLSAVPPFPQIILLRITALAEIVVGNVAPKLPKSPCPEIALPEPDAFPLKLLLVIVITSICPAGTVFTW
jgi:hypothetical protein